MGSNAQTQLRSVPTAQFTTSTDVKLTLPARPENVSVIRHVLGAFAEALKLPDELVEDLRLAVTEACTNVVRHPYPPERPRPSEISTPPAPGPGLPLIAAIADEVERQPVPGGGSRVAMTFSRQRRGDAA